VNGGIEAALSRRNTRSELILDCIALKQGPFPFSRLFCFVSLLVLLTLSSTCFARHKTRLEDEAEERERETEKASQPGEVQLFSRWMILDLVSRSLLSSRTSSCLIQLLVSFRLVSSLSLPSWV